MTYAPEIAGWLRPRVDLASNFTLLRDPNAPLVGRLTAIDSVPATPGTPAAPQLALRLGNTRTFTTGAGIDVAKAGTRYGGPESFTARVAQFFLPIDVSFTRGILSSYDAAPNAPGAGYQLGIGTITGFRSLDGGRREQRWRELAAGALGRARSAAGRHDHESHAAHDDAKLGPPPGVGSDDDRRRPDRVSRSQRAMEPARPPVRGIGEISGHQRTAAAYSAIAGRAVGSGRREPRGTRDPRADVSGQRIHDLGGGRGDDHLGYSYRTQTDSLPGSVTHGNSNETSAEVGRTFALPADWGLKSGLRARLGFQQTRNQSYVQNLFAESQRSRLTDNGRQAFTLNADTDVAENATFSIQGSRIVNFDHNLNRRLMQTVITAVLQMQFFAGDLR